ncbi:MAG: hypothetical protein QNJ68_09765 [Microcoleaceae cyanobacterium MO_207.B10]|nr:hypothetical protein [Microcoleaceae cyanobacterium MO_207.B10]
MSFLENPCETARRCERLLADKDNITPNQERQLQTELKTAKAKMSYEKAKQEVMESQGFWSWLIY